MSRSAIVSGIVAALLLGAAIGAFAGYRYAENRVGRELISTLHNDAERSVRKYERMRQLVESDDDERLLSYLDSLVHLETTVMKATQEAQSGEAQRK